MTTIASAKETSSSNSTKSRIKCSSTSRKRPKNLRRPTWSLPSLLQSLFGYDATGSGLVLSPAGIFSVALLPVVGLLLGRGTDARRLILAGLIVMGLGNYWLSLMNLEISPMHVVWPRVVTIVGLSLLFAPLNVAAFLVILVLLMKRSVAEKGPHIAAE